LARNRTHDRFDVDALIVVQPGHQFTKQIKLMYDDVENKVIFEQLELYTELQIKTKLIQLQRILVNNLEQLVTNGL